MNKNVIDFADMQNMQKELQELHKGEWNPLTPIQARNQMLWLVDELGEAIAIIKKKGEHGIMEDENIRENFCAEIADVLMYLNDVLLCYDITPEEISAAYTKKHDYNMKRNYVKQNEKLYHEYQKDLR